jgi:glycosyltransferase involved in cell wall biosynthesis
MCYQLPEPTVKLPAGFLNLFDDWLPHAHEFLVLGGETFLADECLQWFRKLTPGEFPHLGLAAITNGLCFSDTICRLIASRRWHWILVSIDAASSGVYRKVRGGDFSRLKRNLDNLAETRAKMDHKFELSFSFTLQRSNLDDLIPFLDLCDKYGAVPDFPLVAGSWHNETPGTQRDVQRFLAALDVLDKQLYARGWPQHLIAPVLAPLMAIDNGSQTTANPMPPRLAYAVAPGDNLIYAARSVTTWINPAIPTYMICNRNTAKSGIFQSLQEAESNRNRELVISAPASLRVSSLIYRELQLAFDDESDWHDVRLKCKQLSEQIHGLMNQVIDLEIVVGKAVKKYWSEIKGYFDDLPVRRFAVRLPYWEAGEAVSGLDYQYTIDRIKKDCMSLGWSFNYGRPGPCDLGLVISNQYPHAAVVYKNRQKRDIFISVIVPVYNKAKELSTFIHSLARQQGDINFEVILVDDGSSDDSIKVAEALADTLIARADLLVIQLDRGADYQDNTFTFRAGTARQVGINYSRGNHILFIDPDQEVDNDCVFQHAWWARQGFDVIIGHRDLPVGYKPGIGHLQWAELKSRSLLEQELWWPSFFTGNASVSRKLLIEVGGFDETLQLWGLDDMDLAFRLAKAGARVWHTPRAKVTHLSGAPSGAGKAGENLDALRHIGMEILYRKYLDPKIFDYRPDLWYVESTDPDDEILEIPDYGLAPKDYKCYCPICHWRGREWKQFIAKPGCWDKSECPRCKSLPRERIIWLLLKRFRDINSHKQMKILEVGGVRHFGIYMEKEYFYRNADIEETGARIDYYIKNGIIPENSIEFHAGILSAVLSVITSEQTRIQLLGEFYRLTGGKSMLVIFDDFDPWIENHMSLSLEKWFHPQRFGRQLLTEIKTAGWCPTVVYSVTGMELTGSEVALPFIIAFKNPGSSQQLV